MEQDDEDNFVSLGDTILRRNTISPDDEDIFLMAEYEVKYIV